MNEQAQGERAFFRLLGAVRSARVELDVPLRAGRFRFPGPRRTEPQLLVDPMTRLGATLELVRHTPGELSVETAELRFSPMVSLTNPARAFARERGFLRHILYTIADWFVDVGVARLYFDGDGRLAIDGVIAKLWPFGSTPLRLTDDQMRALPRIQGKLMLPPWRGPITKEVKPAAPKAPLYTPDLELLLERAGAMLGEGTLSIEISTDEIALADRRYVSVSAGVAPASLRLDGKVSLDRAGKVRFSIEEARPAELQTSLATLSLSGEAAGEVRARTLHVDVHARARITPSEPVLTITPVPDVVLPVTLDHPFEVSGRAKVLVEKGVPSIPEARGEVALEARIAPQHQIELDEVSIALAAGAIKARGSGGFSLRDGVGRLSDGELELTVLADDPRVAYRDTEVEIDGGVTVRVAAGGGEFDGATRKGSVRGELRIDFQPEEATRARMPELANLHGELDFAVELGHRTLELDLGDGLLGLLDPIFDLRGRPDSIVAPTGAAAGPPASDAMRRRITELTGAEVTEGNRVTLVIDGVMSYPRRLALIDGARESICVQTLIFRDDESGNEIARRLVAAAKRGVAVRVIVDALGNVQRLRDLLHGLKVYDVMRDGGVDLRLYNHPAQSALRQLLVDIMEIPGLGGADSREDLTPLTNPAMVLRLFTRLVRAAKEHRRVGTALGRVLDVTQRIARRDPRSYGAPDEEPTLDLVDVIYALRQAAGLNHRWHEKYVIADGRAVILGGMNIGDEYMFGGTDRVIDVLGKPRPVWRDTDVEIHGPAATWAYREFGDNWKTLAGEDLPAVTTAPPEPGGVPIQIVQHRPRDDGDHNIQNVMLEQLKALGRGDKAWLVSSYFLPVGALAGLKTALQDAARRGVDVRVVTNAASTTDLPEINYAAVYSYRELIPAGVRVFERTGTRTMHTKAAVLGGNTTVIGSWNCDNRSEALNSEVVAVIYDEALAKQAEEMFLRDSAPDVARELTERDIETQPLDEELRSLGLAAIGDLL